MNDCVLEQFADCVDEAVIEKHLRYEEKIKMPSKFFTLRNWKMAAISACIVLFVLGGFFAITNGFLQYPMTDDTEQLFIINTYAMNGEVVEVDPYEGTYNSGYIGDNLFGVDCPIFSFDVIPTAIAEEKLKAFDIEVSVVCEDKYNEKEHIAISYLFLQGDGGGSVGYSISGWFEEPTSITVVLTDKKTQKIIEEITVGICYYDDVKAYKLTLIETKAY